MASESRVKLSMIVAMDRHRAIGRDNDLPWRLPDDLKRFKTLTLGKPILMGRRTAESLGRTLPGRANLVLTRSGCVPFDGMIAVAGLDQALAHARAAGQQELCVIGGGQVYQGVLPHADLLHLTLVDTVVDGADAWFPVIDPGVWQTTPVAHHPADVRHAHAFDFVDCVRRSGV